MGEADPFQRLFTIAVEQARDWYAVDSRALTDVPALSIEAACAMVRGKLSGHMPTVLADDLYTLADKLQVPTYRSPAYVDGRPPSDDPWLGYRCLIGTPAALRDASVTIKTLVISSSMRLRTSSTSVLSRR
jgi:hypothetical protein